MADNLELHFFKCSVSADLYGACPECSGESLPTPGGGTWLPVSNLKSLGTATAGYDPVSAAADIAKWGCHWFTSTGPCDIFWGPSGPPN